jgi:putative hydrolase of the HAD superfamily
MPYMKPNAAAFRAALGAIGLEEGERAVFVGDRPLDDIHGAQQVGMRAVLRPNDLVMGYDVQPDATIRRLPELLPLLDGWMNEV